MSLLTKQKMGLDEIEILFLLLAIFVRLTFK